MAKWIPAVLISTLIIALPCAPFAYEEDAEETEFTYGTVIRVDELNNEIVVREYDFDSDMMAEVTYSVSLDTELENVETLKEITAGMDVDIQYVAESDGKKIAKRISIDTPGSEEYEFDEPIEEITDETEEVEWQEEPQEQYE